MNKSRIFRMVSALTIVGIVASQVPSRSAVSLAADGYPESNALLQQSLVNVLVGGLVVGGAASVIKGSSGGGVFGGGGMSGGSKPIYDLTKSKDDFSIVASIINNAGETEMYRTGEYTVFWPTDDAITKDLGADGVKKLQQVANKNEAIEFLNRITVKGKINLSKLKEMAESGTALEPIAGDPILPKIVNGKLTVNGVEMLGAEYPSTNGWVLVANGVVNKEQS